MRVRAALVLVSLLALACGGGSTAPAGDGGVATDGGLSAGDCPSGLSKKVIAGVEMCTRTPTQEAIAYDEGTDTTTCGDPVTPIDMSCYTTPATAPALPATITIEGFVDTFGLEKATTGVTVEVQRPDGTVISTVASNANHRCARTKTVGTKTVILAGYTIPNVPTNQLVVFKNSGPEFRNTYSFGQHFDTTECQTPAPVTDDTCHSGCFTRNGQIILRHDTNAISNQTWTLIPLTAGYNRGIARGNAAFAGQIHDCKDNQLKGAAIGFQPTANAKVMTYFNGNCEDPNANISVPFSNRDSLYAGLDATPTTGAGVKVTAEALVGGVLKNVGLWDLKLYPDSVSLLTLHKPVPTVIPADGGM